MTIRKDNYFSLTKSERRATLVLLIIVLLLVGARVAQQHYHTRVKQEEPTEAFHEFQEELDKFNHSLKEKPQADKREKRKKEKKAILPKPLTPVPREE